MRKQFLRLATILLAVAVALGAFGAHGLEGLLEPDQLAVFKTGVLYHFIHAVGILAVGILLYVRKTPWIAFAGWSFLLGIVLFSGSLYLLSVATAFDLPLQWIGPLTPIGGVFFITGWLLLFASTYQANEKRYRKARAES